MIIFGLPAGAFTLVLFVNGEYGIVVDDSSGVGVGIVYTDLSVPVDTTGEDNAVVVSLDPKLIEGERSIFVDVGSTVCPAVACVGTTVVVETCIIFINNIQQIMLVYSLDVVL